MGGRVILPGQALLDGRLPGLEDGLHLRDALGLPAGEVLALLRVGGDVVQLDAPLGRQQLVLVVDECVAGTGCLRLRNVRHQPLRASAGRYDGFLPSCLLAYFQNAIGLGRRFILPSIRSRRLIPSIGWTWLATFRPSRSTIVG